MTPGERGTGRVFRRGNVCWIAYYHHGKEIRESAGTNEEKKAVKLLRQRLKEIGADEVGARTFIPRQDRVLVGTILDRLEADFRLREIRGLDKALCHMKPVRAFFGDMRAIHVEEATIDQYIKDRLDARKAPATVNRETQLLTQSFTRAVKRRVLSFAPLIPKLPERNVRTGFFERSEFEGVLGHLPEYLKDFTRFAYLTAWRRGEIVSLAWENVDYGARILWLRRDRSKNGEARKIALEGDLLEIFERRWEARRYSVHGVETLSPLVFHRGGKPVRDFRKSWKAACEAAGVKRLFHDFRRTGVRNMDRAGVRQTVAMAISGHKTDSVYRRYNITSDDDLRQAVLQTQEYVRKQPVERRVASIRKK